MDNHIERRIKALFSPELKQLKLDVTVDTGISHPMLTMSSLTTKTVVGSITLYRPAEKAEDLIRQFSEKLRAKLSELGATPAPLPVANAAPVPLATTNPGPAPEPTSPPTESKVSPPPPPKITARVAERPAAQPAPNWRSAKSKSTSLAPEIEILTGQLDDAGASIRGNSTAANTLADKVEDMASIIRSGRMELLGEAYRRAATAYGNVTTHDDVAARKLAAAFDAVESFITQRQAQVAAAGEEPEPSATRARG